MIEAKITGIGDYKAALQSIVPKMRKRVVLQALKAAARVIQKAARANTPVLTLANQLKAPYRKPGTVRNAISVRTSGRDQKAGDIGVFVNVRPAAGAKYKTVTGGKGRNKVKIRQLVKGSKKGANSPDDPFYWKWLEFGKRGYVGRGFLQKAAQQLGQALVVFEKTLGPKLQALDKNPSDPL